MQRERELRERERKGERERGSDMKVSGLIRAKVSNRLAQTPRLCEWILSGDLPLVPQQTLCQGPPKGEAGQLAEANLMLMLTQPLTRFTLTLHMQSSIRPFSSDLTSRLTRKIPSGLCMTTSQRKALAL